MRRNNIYLTASKDQVSERKNGLGGFGRNQLICCNEWNIILYVFQSLVSKQAQQTL